MGLLKGDKKLNPLQVVIMNSAQDVPYTSVVQTVGQPLLVALQVQFLAPSAAMA